MRLGPWLLITCLAFVGCKSGEAPVPETPAASAIAETETERTEPAASADPEHATEPDNEVEHLDYIELTTGGADSNMELPMLVVIHGYGDSPEGISGLYRGLQVPVRLIMPRGPLPHPRGGHSWYDISSADYAAQVEASTDRVAELVEALADTRPTSTTMVSGFSQGGILSYELAAHHDGLFDVAFPIAGKLPNSEGLEPPVGGATTVVHAFHGAADDRIAFADGEQAVATLQEAGWTAEMTSIPGLGHSINPTLRSALYEAVTATVTH